MKKAPLISQPISPRTVAVLAFDGISPFHLAVPAAVFGEVHRFEGAPTFDFHLCAAQPGILRTSVGFALEVEHDLSVFQQADILIVPSWDVEQTSPPALRSALCLAHQQGRYVVGLCLGAFVLAEAGLLNGQTATTHWQYAPEFSRRYPEVRLDANVLYASAGRILTSAGTAAGLDCCLFLLQELCGSRIANAVARRLVVSPHRAGGQAQFIEQPIPQSGEQHRLSELLHWLSAHLPESHSLDELAARVAMSRRSFTRHFRQLTGATVGQWLLVQRINYAKRLLEETDMDMERIATQVGLGSALSLRQHFSAQLHLSPSMYRMQFAARASIDAPSARR